MQFSYFAHRKAIRMFNNRTHHRYSYTYTGIDSTLSCPNRTEISYMQPPTDMVEISSRLQGLLFELLSTEKLFQTHLLRSWFFGRSGGPQTAWCASLDRPRLGLPCRSLSLTTSRLQDMLQVKNIPSPFFSNPCSPSWSYPPSSWSFSSQ